MTIATFGTTTLGSAAQAVVEGLAPKREPFAPGIYFGLDEDTYHADTALGSTSMKKLAESPPDYWFSSPHNTLRREDSDTPSRIFGRAVHKFVLEGREAFERAYAPSDFNGATKEGKAESARIAAAGKTRIKRDDWERIVLSGSIIRANPAISGAFSGGAPEVSVFWERDGIRRKARFDYLKVRACVDLKSDANPREIAFPEACRRAIAQYRYDVQAAHYDEARAMLPQLVAAGAVHGDHDPEWLRKVAASQEWAFVWIFYQSQRAPLTWGTTLSHGNGLFDLARATLAKAEANYRDFAARFGFDTPWVLAEPLAELDVNDLPAWSFRS
jgi:hypothetical protein